MNYELISAIQENTEKLESILDHLENSNSNGWIVFLLILILFFK